jgi:hypothetical protein
MAPPIVDQKMAHSKSRWYEKLKKVYRIEGWIMYLESNEFIVK